MSRWFPTASLCLLLLSLNAAAVPLHAQGAWKAGVAVADITPESPIWLAGYGNRTKPSEGVLQRIHAKALVLQDETGAKTVLVTMDLESITKEVAGPVAERLRREYQIPRSRIAFNASHTHSGPVIGFTRLPAYPYGPEEQSKIEVYTKQLEDQIVQAVGLAIQNLAPAHLAFGQGFAGFAVNRRRQVMQRSLPGPVDQDVPVLSVRSADGALKVVVFGYACHNTVLNTYEINGDWAGFAQEDIEKANAGAVAMFVQDCGADANPLPRRSVAQAQTYGEIMAAAVDEVLHGKMSPQSGPIRADYALVDVYFQSPAPRAEWDKQAASGDPAQRRYAQYILDEWNRDGRLPEKYPYPVQVWQFGDAAKDGFLWILLGGEVVVDYALEFKGKYGWANTWVASYSNDVFTYIPSVRVLREGGYEGGDVRSAVGLPAPFTETIEPIIAGAVDTLVNKTSGLKDRQ